MEIYAGQASLSFLSLGTVFDERYTIPVLVIYFIQSSLTVIEFWKRIWSISLFMYLVNYLSIEMLSTYFTVEKYGSRDGRLITLNLQSNEVNP